MQALFNQVSTLNAKISNLENKVFQTSPSTADDVQMEFRNKLFALENEIQNLKNQNATLVKNAINVMKSDAEFLAKTCPDILKSVVPVHALAPLPQAQLPAELPVQLPVQLPAQLPAELPAQLPAVTFTESTDDLLISMTPAKPKGGRKKKV